ncbi:glycosyltransferase family 39 protein [Leptospira sp. 2 VSF19]|uniref:Glycosyltransferase family 39 protein n=1 Tax=Leptospira soteropolitanensis TaxID=2950025 RepID=A0AAW5VM50_9LEPT|nr:glycosyltransferase family 39 protein [Leptospira soteropolitanensis]MCW7492892.1 glycosyltransferase family 39 protein [Leptospira soteropolitanensis]MCW7500127.1 glycosyltransferase family 39 protein [Leptospira soteropolitanensis]MCW7522378.1 glycosyltransferase family 39 protein [Leptospira soteropolitanensis]MCW7526234.1 glycosyltransferase family 39 protein [Leptospira soteropolitanensis]MCW7529654.1 glycosyltransferase family 39 protein [Leptospira soteropolitanensis]
MKETLTPSERIIYRILLLLASLPVLFTLPLDVIDIDSSQYASISRELVLSGDFFTLFDNGRRYLDKPILTFWTIATSFSLFGISNIAFRIPAIFLSLLSVYSIYRITILTGGKERQGYLASFAYLLAPGFYAMVVDPKIDVYLTAYLVFTYHFYYLGRKKNPNYFYLMYLMMSMGFITKGPISVVIPALSIGGDILFRRDWKLLLSMRIPTGILVLASLPAFWCVLLYKSFNSYGPSFFLWIQSFGRFYKEMYDVKFDPFYFYKSFSWAFFSGVVPMIIYIAFRSYNYIKSLGWKEILRKIRSNEYKDIDFVIPFWVFLFLFLISFSRFPLPQYTYWVLPGAALYFGKIAEESLFRSSVERLRPSFLIAGLVYLVGYFLIPVFVAEVGIVYYVFGAIGILLILLLAQLIPLEVLVTLVGATLFFSSISLQFYPLLTSYQPAKEFGAKIKELEPNEPVVYTFWLSNSKRSYGFYAERNFRNVYDKDKLDRLWSEKPERLLILPSEKLSQLKEFAGKDYTIEPVLERESFKVATPNVAFLKKETRNLVTKKISLVWLKKIQGKSSKNSKV